MEHRNRTVIGQRGSIARTLTGLAESVSSDARQVRSAEQMSQDYLHARVITNLSRR
jgi:hypothetical protein